HFKPTMLQAEVVGVRHATDCEQRVRADDSLIAAAAINLHGYFVAAFFKADAFSVQTNLDTFAFENCFDVFGNVFVFTFDQSRPSLHNVDLTAEAAIHLSKLQPHIAAADDDQVLRQKVHVHHR